MSCANAYFLGILVVLMFPIGYYVLNIIKEEQMNNVSPWKMDSRRNDG